MNYPSVVTMLFILLNLVDICVAQRFFRRQKRHAANDHRLRNFSDTQLTLSVPPKEIIPDNTQISHVNINPIILESMNQTETETEGLNKNHTNAHPTESSTSDLPANNSTTHTDELSPSEKEFIEEFMEKEEEIIKKKEEVVAEEVGGISTLIGIAFMIFTAYQMSENPDGVCASLCRLTFTVAGCFVKILLWPFKKMCGHRFSGYAHHLVATQDYGETSLFQIS